MPRFSLTHFIFSISIICSTPNLYCQNQLKFDHLTIKEGLSNNNVRCILRDSEGYFWIGTEDGLNRYDGYGFTIFKNELYDSSTLINSYIQCMYEDVNHRLWVGTRGGLNLFNRESNTFKRFYQDEKSFNGFKGSYVSCIFEDRDQNLWLGTNKGVFQYNAKLGIFTYLNLDAYLHEDYLNVWTINQDQDGDIWFGFDGNGLLRYNAKSKSAKHFKNEPGNPASIICNNIISLHIDNKNRLWIGTRQGLDLYQRDKMEFVHYSSTDKTNTLPNDLVNSIVEINKNELFICTAGGIAILNPETHLSQHILSDPNNEFSILNNIVECAYIDKNFGIWIGTRMGGVDIYNKNKYKFSLFKFERNSTNCLSHNKVTDFGEDSKHNIYISTDGGGVNCYNKTSGKFSHIQSFENKSLGISNNKTLALKVDGKDNIWIGTWGGGLNYYNTKTKTAKHYRNDPNSNMSISSDNVMDILEDSDGDIWIGTWGAGINKYDPVKDEFIRYPLYYHGKIKLANEIITVLFQDSFHTIWIGTQGGGLYKYNKQRDEFTHFSNIPSNENSISSNNIFSISQDSKNRLWIGTDGGGLNLFDMHKNIFYRFNKRDGLPNEVINGILNDNSGNLWISSNQGISKIQLIDSTGKLYLQVNTYDIESGLQSNQFNNSAYFKSDDGQLYFGGINGFNVFHPDSIAENKIKPPVKITDFLLFNKSILTDEKDFRFRKQINLSDEIVLHYNQSVVTIKYVALNYLNSNQNKYAYKMEGFDKDWIYAGSERKATYTNLDPGRYVFRVKASNNDGVWNEEGAFLRIRILPPIYKTWWAYTIYCFIVLLALYFFRKYSLIKIKTKNKLMLENLEKTKEDEINKMKLQFFTNISHEFRTPLTLILGPLEQILTAKKKNIYYEKHVMIYKNAKRLLQLINQILDFRKIDTGNMQLFYVQGNIVEFIREIKTSFDEFARQHTIDYNLTSSCGACTFWFDSDKVEKIIYNLLSNAFKFTPDGGKITIDIQLLTRDAEDEVLIISVEDNGIGISKERLQKIFTRFYQIKNNETLKDSLYKSGSGIGLSLTKELIELHKGKIFVESEPAKGSKFIIELPNLAAPSYKNENNPVQINITNKENQEFVFPTYDEETKFSEELNHENYTKEKKSTIQQEFKEKILIVENDTDMQAYLRDLFEDKFQVILAGNGLEGYNIALEEDIILIISDVMMPEMNGIELCLKLKTELSTSHIPVILLTAKSTEENQIEGLETGADSYFIKPFNHKILELQVDNLIQSRKKIREQFNRDTILTPKDVNLKSTDEKFLHRAMEIIEKHIENPNFDSKMFQSEIGMSRQVLSRKLKALTNNTIVEFIRTMRMKRAAQLLVQNKLSISEIAYKVGFNNSKYFSTSFHKFYDLTPSEYIAKHMN